MIINDHINLSGTNPLIGRNLDEFGPRFPDMSEAYNKDLRNKVLEAGQDLGLNLKQGVYVMLSGPTYETPAEIRMVGILGGLLELWVEMLLVCLLFQKLSLQTTLV